MAVENSKIFLRFSPTRAQKETPSPTYFPIAVKTGVRGYREGLYVVPTFGKKVNHDYIYNRTK